MTVATQGNNSMAEFGDDIGLEDLDASDLTLPRVQIIHAQGMFKDSLSNEEFQTLNCVILGMVKQRVMWDKDVEDGDRPLCKSPDFQNGFPNTDPDTKNDKRFPWSRSNFDPNQFGPDKPSSINGFTTLPCAQCKFKDWDNSAPGGKGAPPCAEQYTFVIMYTPDGGETFQPALLTLQKTGIKPSKSYMSSFVQSKTPMFTVNTSITLDVMKRGSVTYSVPKFRKGEATDRNMWPDYAQNMRTIRDFVRTPPRPAESEEDVTETVGNEWNGPGNASTPGQTPNQTVVANVNPPAATAPEPTAPAAQAPAPTPAATPAPAPAPTPTPAPAAQAPAPAAPAAEDDDDDLPF